MKIEFEGRTCDLDLAEIGLKPAFVITGHMGMPITKWEAAIADPDGDDWLKAMRCLYWLMLQQNGDVQPLADVDFPVLSFYKAYAAALAAEYPEAAAADPTTLAVLNGAAEPALPLSTG